MIESLMLFGQPIAHAPDARLLRFVAAFDFTGFLAVLPISAWIAAVAELEFRGLLPLDGYAEWAEHAEAIP